MLIVLVIGSNGLTLSVCLIARCTGDIYNADKIRDFPMFCVHILFWYMWTMLALFGNFFVQSYLKPKPTKQSGAASAAADSNKSK